MKHGEFEVDDLPSALSMRGLTVAFGDTPRLRNVTADFPALAISAVLGASGCGKSTLLRALNRTLELVPGARISGSVHACGVDLYAPEVSPTWVRKQIGMLQQRPTAFPLSIIENVLFGARFHGLVDEPLACARRYLERVGLWNEVKDRLKGSALALSGGQQQRLCLARTLATQPRIVLMDEPCSALDPRATAVIESLARELASEYTLIIVTHNVAQARRLARFAFFFDEGELIDSGPCDALLAQAREPALLAYLATA